MPEEQKNTPGQRTQALRLLSDETETFAETIRTLRGLKDIAQPRATELDENPLWISAVARNQALLPKEKRATFRATMLEASPLVLGFLNRAAHTYTNLDDNNNPDENDWERIDPLELLPESFRQEIGEGRDRLREFADVDAEPDLQMFRAPDGRFEVRFEDFEIQWHFWAVLREMQKSAIAPSHVSLLMRSILTMAVSSFEVLVSNLYRAHIMCNPGAAEAPGTKSFSLQDLYDFGSIEDAVAETIFQQADAFSRKGVGEWQKWFNNQPMNIDLRELALDWESTREVFERRNAVVHNGSKVTRQYLKNVADALTDGLVEGRELEIDPEYLDAALSRISVLGVLLAARMRFKLFRRDNAKRAADWLVDMQFELILEEEFEQVAQIARCQAHFTLDSSDEFLIRVNGWIARGRLESPESCRAEVEAWDTGALADNFKAAKQILLRNDETALELIERCLEAELFTVNSLSEWPLFHWMREDGVLDDLIKSEAPELEPDDDE